VLPKVTILIPTYRRPQPLRRALKSALAQTFRDFEVQVCDDASGDETAAVTAEFAARDRRVKYVGRAQNLGMIGNFVRSTEDVRTPFFTVLDDDDVAMPDFLESGLAQLERFSEAPIYCGLLVFCSEAGDCLGAPAAPGAEGLHQPPALMEMMRSQSLGGVIFRTEGLRRAGGLDAEINFSFDTDLLWRIAARWPIVVGRQPGVLHFVYDASVGNSLRAEISLKALRRMYTKTQNDVRDCSAEAMARLREVISDSYARLALHAIQTGQLESAAAAGRVLRLEMNRRLVGLCFERIAASPRLSRPIARLVHNTRGWQQSRRMRKFRHFNPLIRQALQALA